ncbi:VCBS repeat-containing protein [bacterium]|nr:VCBS repeat-containing protein [bacterium]
MKNRHQMRLVGLAMILGLAITGCLDDTNRNTTTDVICQLTFTSSMFQQQVSIIALRLIDQEGKLVWGPQEYAFEEHGATLTEVRPGSNYRVHAGAFEQDGTFICNGFSQVFDAPAGATVDAGTITLRPFGTLIDSGQYINSSMSYGVEMADMDTDGDLDVLVACVSSYNELWLNDGSGNLIFAQYWGQSDANSELAVGDLDGDTDPDVFTICMGGSRPNTIWLNDGNGSLSHSGQNLTPVNAWGIALGDLDKDGDLDAFIANRSGPNSVYFNDGQAFFTDSGQSLGNAESLFVQLGDLDGDGDLDAFVANDGPTNELGAPNKVWLNNGNGVFSDSGQDIGEERTFEVALGDVDGDNDLDAVTANLAGLINRVWLNDGQAHYSDSGQELNSPYGIGVTLGDIDRDGDLDIYFANAYEEPDRVYQNNGLGQFYDTGMRLGISYTVSGALGDLNDDGYLDLFAANMQTGATGSPEDRVYFYTP